VDVSDQASPWSGTAVEAFVDRWRQSAASERANYGLFLIELCEVLGLPRPEPATDEPDRDGYVFERPVHFRNPDGSTNTGFIDLYRHSSFVLETKQGCEAKRETTLLEQAGLRSSRRRRGHGIRGTESWDAAMLRARGQAEQYAKALPEWPRFLIVVDVGHSIETYAGFTGTGKHYAQFPDTNSFRIFLPDVAREEVGARLQAIWLDPLSLDPSRRAAKVTREIADRLAKLGRSLEKEGHSAESVALFLMRSLFTMFADNVGLLRKESYRELLRGLHGRPHTFAPMMHDLWAAMDKGVFSAALGEDVLRFNGGLFENTEAIALDADQVEILIDAAERDWSAVEPAIFGTLLERALDERERPRPRPRRLDPPSARRPRPRRLCRLWLACRHQRRRYPRPPGCTQPRARRGRVSRQSPLAAPRIPGRHRGGADPARDRGGARRGSGAAILAASVAGPIQSRPGRFDHSGSGRGSRTDRGPLCPRSARPRRRGSRDAGLARAGARGRPRPLHCVRPQDKLSG
jgi:hypothetical protein